MVVQICPDNVLVNVLKEMHNKNNNGVCLQHQSFLPNWIDYNVYWWAHVQMNAKIYDEQVNVSMNMKKIFLVQLAPTLQVLFGNIIP